MPLNHRAPLLAALTLTLTAGFLGHAAGAAAAASPPDDLAASRQAYASAGAGSSDRQMAAWRLGLVLLRRATSWTAGGAQPAPAGKRREGRAEGPQTPPSGQAAPTSQAAPASQAAPTSQADLTEAEQLFREVLSAGGQLADVGEAGLLATLVARGTEGAADLGAELQRLRQGGRGTGSLLCLAMHDLQPKWRDRQTALAAMDRINDRVHSLLPDAPYLNSGRVSMPKGLSTPMPRYTATAREAKLRGSISFLAVIDREGHVADLLVVKPGPFTLTDPAVATVRKWTYRPALLDGQPVPACNAFVVSFDVQ